MECTVSWTGGAGTRSGMGFIAETGSGHVLAMDGAQTPPIPPTAGKTWRRARWRLCWQARAAARPTTSYSSSNGDGTTCGVQRQAHFRARRNRAQGFTRIHMHFTVTGKALPPAAVERAIAMSHEKYCSASIMLGKTAEITTGFDVIEA